MSNLKQLSDADLSVIVGGDDQCNIEQFCYEVPNIVTVCQTQFDGENYVTNCWAEPRGTTTVCETIPVCA